jgi:hypothetical protein
MPNYIPAVPQISNHNTCETIRTQCKMVKHKLQSLDTHKYKTTFTSTTKIVLRFSSYFLPFFFSIGAVQSQSSTYIGFGIKTILRSFFLTIIGNENKDERESDFLERIMSQIWDCHTRT